MDARAAITPGLPRPNPTASYWQIPPDLLWTHRSSPALPSSASVVIVGSGITGASIAFDILSRPSAPSVLLLEARTAASGASGRNGGHTKCASYRSFLNNLEMLGEEEAIRIVKFEYNCMKAVHSFAREHGIDCDSWEGDTVDVIYDQGEWHLAKEAIAEIQKRLGVNEPAAKYQFYGPEETEKKFLTPGALGSVSYEAGSINAYHFVVGILGLAVGKGLNLQTETPVVSVSKSSPSWIVKTARGMVRCEQLVLATNGYTAHLYPPLQGKIVPLRGHVTAHRPGSGLPRTGLSASYSFIYEGAYEYMIPRPEGTKFAGDIIIGGCSTKGPSGGIKEFGTTDDTVVNPVIISCLRDCTAEYFGRNWGDDDPSGRIRQQWSGIMGYSVDELPFVGEIPDERNLFIAASFQGHGMVLCYLTAKALVRMMYKDEEEDLDCSIPKAFHITKSRMEKEFKGRLHTTTSKGMEERNQ